MNFEEILHKVVVTVVYVLEGMGIFVIIIAAGQTFYSYIKSMFNPNKRMIRIQFAKNMVLALEFKLASEIIRSVIIEKIEELYILGAVIAIRVILTFVIHWEIKTDMAQKKSDDDLNLNKKIKRKSNGRF
ncbi:DUF1622 domain-containing protein [Oceanirhabdus sp. W0125-5]|uniref:DUF1622 domain-containing protein n=1 Tax=Oceanirhabdus sp. W0125-5 TaxID=2999116 RepID=UPI0022F3148E|nr:DUF1622 domain-containing protein [Oceanirhabdus sp. W0125-5]WBW97010.1 DUF1622 domain-containing protein [Oceanirhabdus sp. W0125-5]